MCVVRNFQFDRLTLRRVRTAAGKAFRDDTALVSVLQQTMETKMGLFSRIRTRIAWKKARRRPDVLPATPEEPTATAVEREPAIVVATATAASFVYDPEHPTPLLTLPNELLLLTASFLSAPRDLSALLRTNRRLSCLVSPLCLQNLDCSITALCWAALTSNQPLMRLLLSKRGPGFVLYDALGTVVYPADRGGMPKLVWIFVLGPKLRITVPGKLEGEVTVKEWAEKGRFVKLLSYCWSTEVRGDVWGTMVKEGL